MTISPEIEIIYGSIGEADFPKAESLRWVHQPHAGVEGFMYPAFKASDVRVDKLSKIVRAADF